MICISFKDSVQIDMCSLYPWCFMCALCIALVVCIYRALRTKVTLPQLHYRESALARHLLKKCKLLRYPFCPNIWIQNAHVQTMLGAMLSSAKVYFDREYLQMTDRGVIALDWVINAGLHIRKNNPILIVIPDLTDEPTSVKNLCFEAAHKGFRIVVFNRRGHGSSVLTTPRLQSIGDPTDLRQAVRYIKARYPRSRQTAVSIGGGSCLLVSYLGEFGSSARLSAGVCISPAYDAPEQISKSPLKVYDYLLLYRLKRILITHRKALSKVIDTEIALRSTSISEFSRNVYCKFYDYENFEQYWEKNNPMRDVDDITVPLLCINSLDDPISGENQIPFKLFRYYPNLLLVATNEGGYCGFIEGLRLNSWAHRLCINYLEAVLEFTGT